MDKYCKDMWQSLDEDEILRRMFRNWQETWEKKKLGASGDVMLHEKLEVKYVGLKLDENKGECRLFTVHPIQFVKEDQRKYYRIVAVLKEFDTTMPLEDNDDGRYDLWDFCPETYDCFRAYYDLYSNEDDVLVYEQVGVCDSDVNEEEDRE